MKDYIEDRKDNTERRFTSPDIQVRNDGDSSSIIEGIAAVVNSPADIGWYEERIAPGAFDNVMKGDTVALFNHDPNLPLARTTAKGEGNLELFLNSRGDLGYRFKTPNTSVGRDLAENIRTGIIAKSSFAFTIEKDEWEEARDGKPTIRTITKFKSLPDISPVTYPAYNQTSVESKSDVAVRSWERSREPNKDYLKDKVARDKYFRGLDLKKR